MAILSFCSKTFLLVAVLAAPTSLAATYQGFNQIQDDKCEVLPDNEMKALPTDWWKYKGFVKRCELKRYDSSKAIVSLISIWSHDYLDAQKQTKWEKFPLPVLVDDQFQRCGTLPELYPTSYVNSLYVNYGRWKGGIPTEIRIDVADPTISGDYYYPPLLWSEKERTYKMKSTAPISGKRPR